MAYYQPQKGATKVQQLFSMKEIIHLQMKTDIDVFCCHARTQCRNTDWSCEFSWLFLFSCVLNVRSAICCCRAGSAALGDSGRSKSPGAVQQHRCRVNKGGISLFSVSARRLAAPLGICPLETALRSLTSGYTGALQELQCGN